MEPGELIARMVSISNREDTTGLAADALREGSEALEAALLRISERDELLNLLRLHLRIEHDGVNFDRTTKARELVAQISAVLSPLGG